MLQSTVPLDVTSGTAALNQFLTPLQVGVANGITLSALAVSGAVSSAPASSVWVSAGAPCTAGSPAASSLDGSPTARAQAGTMTAANTPTSMCFIVDMTFMEPTSSGMRLCGPCCQDGKVPGSVRGNTGRKDA